jgi:hypothetical protein
MEPEGRPQMTYGWFKSRLTKRLKATENTTDYRKREPLDHPALSRMTLDQLADLPMPGYTKENCSDRIRVT